MIEREKLQGMMVSYEKLKSCLQQQSAIQQAILFGSLATGCARFDSDIDLAIQLDHVMSAQEKTLLINNIAAITGRSVDLIDLKVAGQPLLGQIIKYGKRLAGDDVSYGMLLSKNAFDQADFLPCRQRILDERRQAWIGC